MKNFTSLFLFFFPLLLTAQVNLQNTLTWSVTPPIHTPEGTEQKVEIHHFEGAIYKGDTPSIPYVAERINVPPQVELQVRIVNVQYESFDKLAHKDDVAIEANLNFNTYATQERQKTYGWVEFIPIRKTSSGYERLIAYDLEVTWKTKPTVFSTKSGGGNTRNSVLESGTIYKIATNETGVHRLTYEFLKTDLGIDIDNVNPTDIQLYGNGGGMLPERNDAARIDDLVENAIQIVGGEDGSFDAEDYILFYAEGAEKWTFDASKRRFSQKENVFETQNFYFIKTDGANGKRITNQSSLASTAYTSTSFDDFAHFEEDLVNLLDPANGTQGTGKTWFGDLFKGINEKNYEFNFPNLIPDEFVKVKSRIAGRSTSSTYFSIDAGGVPMVSSNLTRTYFDRPTENVYARLGTINDSLKVNSTSTVNLRLSYPTTNTGVLSNASAEGWLDYIEVQVRRNLQMAGSQMAFRDVKTLDYSNATFQLNGNGVTIWDISDPLEVKNQEFSTSGSQITFGADTEELKQFIAFDGNQFLSAEAIGNIVNQNLHGIDNTEFVIVYHSDFMEQANRLAEHRRTHSNMTVETVEVSMVYNEFSSGKQDPTAIRDFAKMLVDRSDSFKYLLLFGDGSFDYRDIKDGTNSNFVPVYETNESLSPIRGYPSDDYYGLLSDNEGTPVLTGALDIGVGRLPVKTVSEANAVVDKIINYDTNPEAMGDWRTRMVFVADDEDSNTHLNDTDEIAALSEELYPNFNQDKIYLDAFPQVSTAGGEGYPTVTEALNNNMFKGMLAINYLGHGGSGGWTQERVLDRDRGDINKWSNFNQLPLFITATCSFSGYDDRNQVTAGEQVLLNPRGGGIGLLTTVRAVYANSNATLVRSVFNTLFKKIDGRIPTLGDVVRDSKNNTSVGENNRKFTLLGDPSMQLALPQHQVVTQSIDATQLDTTSVDTLQALQKVTIAGIIADESGQILEDFNGELFPTLYDKATTYSTLGQDSGSPVKEFELQKNIIFKGRASIKQGRWEFTFVVPKDINYKYGFGKISYYATNGKDEDAAGSYERIIVGGTNAAALADDKGPEVEIYMNTEEFIFGGVTDANPTLLVKLADDNGINVAGNSIGHDLEGVLDNNTQNTYLLNDFYEAALDDYTKGEVRYPLADLEEGLHTVSVRAWDIANNPAEGYTEFLVSSSAEVALKNVLNYPNPFINNTCFQFDHNLRGQEMDVLVHIYTVSGRLVKTLAATVLNEGGLRQDDCIPWDGLDDYGDILGRGVYVYKVKVRATNPDVELKGESEFEKLVILK